MTVNFWNRKKYFSRLNLWNELSSVKMVVMSSQNVVNRKFSFGSGPKRAVDRINKYFRDSTSISRALHNLLDKFDGDEQTDCEKKQARERLAKYRYFFLEFWHNWWTESSSPESLCDDVYEIGKTILLGKPADDLQSIKESFTRFSRLLNDCGAYHLLAARVDRDEKEAPVLFLEHVITLKPPTTKGNYQKFEAKIFTISSNFR